MDIAPGRADVISVRKGDHAHELAKEFVERNRLAAKVIDPLTDHIKGHLTQLRRDETLAARQQRGRSAEPARPVSARRSRSRSRSRAQSPSPPSHHTFKPAICPTSTAIAQTMGERKDTTAFDRLHQESKARRVEARKRAQDCDAALDERRARTKQGMSGISRAMAETRGELNGAENYGDKLFREGVTHARQKEELLTEIRQQEEMRRDGNDLTFKPKITANARKQRAKVHDDCTDAGRARRQQQLEDYDQLRSEQEMKGCSFQPQISSASKELARRSKRAEELRRRQEGHEEDYEAITVHDELAADVHERQRRLDAYETSEFNPHGVDYKPNVGTSKLRPPTDPDDEAFVDRLVYSNRERERQLDLVRARQSISGGEPFQPRIRRSKGDGVENDGPRRRPEKMSVHEHLYASREQFHDIKNTLAEREAQKRWIESNRCHTKKTSQQHITQRRRRRAREIFRQLAGEPPIPPQSPSRRRVTRGSPTKSGAAGGVKAIDTRQLCLDGFDPRLVKELVPELLRSNQAQGGDGMLDFESFFAIVEDIAADETTQVRAVLHHRPLSAAEAEDRRRLAEEAELTGKPRINPVSREIAEQLMDGDLDATIHGRQMAQMHRQAEVQAAKRVAMEERELEECTFQPRTNQSALQAWRAYRQKESAETRSRGAAGRVVERKVEAEEFEDEDEEFEDEEEQEQQEEDQGVSILDGGFNLAQSRDILRRLAEKVRMEDAEPEEGGYGGEAAAAYE